VHRGYVIVSVKDGVAPAHVPLAIVAMPAEAGNVSLPHRTVVEAGADSDPDDPWMAKYPVLPN